MEIYLQNFKRMCSKFHPNLRHTRHSEAPKLVGNYWVPSTINTAGLQIHLYKASWHREPIFADHGHLIYQQGHK